MPEQAQAGEGYKCSCGKVVTTRKEFLAHLRHASQKDGLEHHSEGRVNMDTGEITAPPWNQRTPEQIKATRHAKKTDNPTGGVIKTVVPTRNTDTLANAMQITLVPRVYTIDYTPILRSAFEAAVRVWGWRPDMPLANFLDTVIYNFFKEHGVTLAAYVVEESEEDKVAREAYLKVEAERRVAETAKVEPEKEKEPVAA